MNKSRILQLIIAGVADPYFESHYFGGGKGDAPPAPDYRGAAIEQSNASKEIAKDSTWANRPNINTPWGSQSWSAAPTTDPATGQPVTSWSSNISLSPDQQAALDDQQNIQAGRSDAAQQLLGQATAGFSTPMDWSKLPSAPGSVEEAQKGAFGKLAANLQPGRAQQTDALETRLANMGLPMGSEAYKRAKAQLQDQFATQDKSLLAQAMSEGRADVTTQQGIRQQAISEQGIRRGMTLNELNALLTGQQVAYPQGMQAPPSSTATGGQAPNLLGAAMAEGNYNSQNQSQGMDWGSAIGGIASVAGAFM